MQPHNVRDAGQTLNCRWSRGSNRGWGESGVPSVVCFSSRDSLQLLWESTDATASHTHAHTRTRTRMHASTLHARTHITRTTHTRHHHHTRPHALRTPHTHAATQTRTQRAQIIVTHTRTCTHSVPRPACIFGFRPCVCDKESAVQSPVPFIASCIPPLAPTPTPPPSQHISFVAGNLGCFGLQFCLSPLALPGNYLLSLLSPFYR